MLKLITEHNDYLLLVDTEAEVFGSLCIGQNNKEIFLNTDKQGIHYCDKIMAHLPLNNTPKLQGVPLLPELPKQEEDFAAIEYAKSRGFSPDFYVGRIIIETYKAASKKWSDEDMRKCWEAAKGFFRSNIQPLNFTEWLQSLSPTLTPIGFEPEYEKSEQSEITMNPEEVWQLKIVNGVLQGRYTYQ